MTNSGCVGLVLILYPDFDRASAAGARERKVEKRERKVEKGRGSK